MARRNRIRIIVIKALLLYSISHSIAQEVTLPEVEFNKNRIYGNVGYAGLYFSATGYYERMIKQKMWNSNISSFVKVGYGAYIYWEGKGKYLLAQYGLLTGAKTHHLEIGIGPCYFITGDLKGDVLVSGIVGWRIQKPGGNFIFRMGAS